jgi:hypothetical protein
VVARTVWWKGQWRRACAWVERVSVRPIVEMIQLTKGMESIKERRFEGLGEGKGGVDSSVVGRVRVLERAGL